MYLREIFSIQPIRSTRSFSCLTISRPPVTTQFSSQVLQLGHNMHHCTTSLERPVARAPLFFSSFTIIENHPPSSPGCCSVYHTSGSSLKIKVPSLQELIYSLIHLIPSLFLCPSELNLP